MPSGCSTRPRSSSMVDASAGTRRSVEPVFGAAAACLRKRRAEPVSPAQEQPESSLVLVVAEAGPATGTIVTLGAGRHVVGRSPSCTVSLADPALEPHHGVFEVADAGSVRFTQLTGRVAAQVDGEPISAAVVVEDGATVGIGCSRLRIGRSAGPAKGAAALTADPADPWRSTVHRTPRPLSRWAPAAIPVPESASSTRLPAGIGVTAAVCTMVGSVVVALVMRSPLFLLLGAVGLLASAGMWVAGRVGAARDGRRAGAIHRRELAAFSTAVAAQRRARWQHHLATTPPVAEAVVAATTTRADVWGRRADHADAFRVTLGWGPVTWEVAVDGSPGDPGTSAGAELDGRGRRSRAVRRCSGPGRARRGCRARHRRAGGGVRRPLADHPAGDVDRSGGLAPRGRRRRPVVVGLVPLAAARAGRHRDRRRRRRRRRAGCDPPPRRRRRRTACRRRHGPPRARRPAHRRAAQVPRCREVIGPRRARAAGRCRTGDVPQRARDRLDRSGAMVGRHVDRCTFGHRPRRRRHARRRRACGSVPRRAARPGGARRLRRRWARRCRSAPCASTTGSARSTTPSPSPRRGGPAVPILLPPHRSALDRRRCRRDRSRARRAARARRRHDRRPARASCCARSSCRWRRAAAPTTSRSSSSTTRAARRSTPAPTCPHTVGLVTDLDDRLAERALTSLEAELRRRERLLRAVGAADLADYRSRARPTRRCRGSSS